MYKVAREVDEEGRLLEEQLQYYAFENDAREKNEFERTSYCGLRENSEWLSTIVEEGKHRAVHDDIRNKLVDALQVKRALDHSADPVKKQRSMADYFSSSK